MRCPRCEHQQNQKVEEPLFVCRKCGFSGTLPIAANGKAGAMIGSSYQELDFHGFALAYLWGAEKMLNSLPVELDLLFFPFCHCLRHALELNLKFVSRLTHQIDDSIPLVLDGHGLLGLANDLDSHTVVLRDHLGWRQSNLFSDDVLNVLGMLDGADSSGQRFRYPELTARAQNHPHLELGGQQVYDLRQLYEIVNTAFFEISGTGETMKRLSE